eukprot:Selendium_serpulae@DN9101_c0_g1_i1.p1
MTKRFSAEQMTPLEDGDELRGGGGRIAKENWPSPGQMRYGRREPVVTDESVDDDDESLGRGLGSADAGALSDGEWRGQRNEKPQRRAAWIGQRNFDSEEVDEEEWRLGGGGGGGVFGVREGARPSNRRRRRRRGRGRETCHVRSGDGFESDGEWRGQTNRGHGNDGDNGGRIGLPNCEAPPIKASKHSCGRNGPQR